MATDPEGQLYKDMADLTEKVPKLQNELAALKKRLTELTKRVESLELMAFQDQISKLGDEVKSTNEDLVRLSRVVVLNEIDTLHLHMERAISKEVSDDKLRERLRLYISVEGTRARERVDNAPSPITILMAFKKECISCSDKYDLGAFAGKP